MNTQPEGIAIIGMAGRFPRAKDLDAFWDNVRNGRECISFFSEDELNPMGLEFPRPDARYLKARGMLENADHFDAAFFGISPKEAEIMDPQQRLFLECAWEALEDAGYDSEREPRPIGVFAGTTFNTYLVNTLLSRPELLDIFSAYQLMLANDKDFLPTRVSYKLNLRGPSITVQTACSTSLVAVCVACQNLLTYQCDMALAGCVSVTFPQKQIHLFQGGGIASPDGHCRAFDAKAQGTVPGEGVGIVVLKRLADALADGDHIYSVIKGFAMNNDGGLKAGYTAPSELGQAEAIAWAQAMAGFDPATIGYLEAHGTGTPLGDPIEIAGLTRAFRARTDAKNFCAIGTVKTSIGHLDVAAGMAGLINATLALHHRTLPPSLNFETPNPKIDFANSPFYVNTRATEWKAGAAPRRAGVSSFGIGSTNAHVVLEEAPGSEGRASLSERAVSVATESGALGERRPTFAPRPAQLLVLSGKTAAALETATKNLSAHLARHPELDLADAAYTLLMGRRAFNHRRVVVCREAGDAVEALQTAAPPRVSTKFHEHGTPAIAFLFPGQGAQRVNMGRELYEHEPVFREQVDRCAEILEPHLGLNVRDLIYPQNDTGRARLSERADATATEAGALGETRPTGLSQTSITQPAMFVIEYALAKLWMSWGLEPVAMIGHSVGEYVAACLAGVFSLEDGLRLIATRGRLMQQLPGGAMLAVRLPEAEVQPLLVAADPSSVAALRRVEVTRRNAAEPAGPPPPHAGGYDPAQLSLAAVNGANQCVVSGATEAIDAFQQQLAGRGIVSHRLETSHAFHSPMVDAALPPFTAAIAQVTLNPPRIPFVSNVSGTWITDTQATDPAYWAQHMRRTVRFADGAGELLKNAKLALLEVGPGQTLSALTRQLGRARVSDRAAATPAEPGALGETRPTAVDRLILSSLPGAQSPQTETEAMLSALGQLWLNGAAIDWTKFYGHETRRRVRLPTYPFERKRFWIEPAAVMLAPRTDRSADSFVRADKNGASNGEHATETKVADPAMAGLLRAPESPRDQLTSELRALFGKLLGLDLATVSGATTFLEMGFDSLMLTQASQGIEKKFGAHIPFGQLMGKLSTFDLLASALDGGSAEQSHEGGTRVNSNGAPANRLANIVKEERK